MASAEQRCRAAWAAAPDAKFAWCCHHSIRIEALTEPAENRIDYILRRKPVAEQKLRLDNFRPVLDVPPILQAWAACDKAWAAYNKAWAAYNKARAAYDKAWVSYTKARAAYAQSVECDILHRAEVPHHTWNGKDIF